MKVFLRANVAGAGRAGDIIDVKEAFARNFLLPKGLAVPATPAVLADAKRKEELEAKQKAESALRLQDARERLSGLTLRLQAKANEQGRLFSSIKGSQIADEVRRQLGLDIGGAHVETSFVKTLGQHPVTLRWPDGQTTVLNIFVDHA